MSDATIEVFRGDSLPLNITITDKNDVPIDITNQKITFTVKADPYADDTQAIIQKVVTTHSDATNGKTEISLNPTDTSIQSGSYYFDIQMTDTITNDVTTIAFGIFIVKEDVTKSI